MTIKDIIKGDSTIQGVTVHQYWRDYDSEGNLIHFKNSNGWEFWTDYDSEGNRIHFKNSDGLEYWYDSNGNRIENPNKVKELTLEDIAEKFGVSVESLRIKD